MLLTFWLGNNLYIESQLLGLSKIPPGKVDDPQSPDFPMKLAIYHVQKAARSRTG